MSNIRRDVNTRIIELIQDYLNDRAKDGSGFYYESDKYLQMALDSLEETLKRENELLANLSELLYGYREEGLESIEEKIRYLVDFEQNHRALENIEELRELAGQFIELLEE